MRHTCVSPDETRKSGNPWNHAEQSRDCLPIQPLQLYTRYTFNVPNQPDKPDCSATRQLSGSQYWLVP